VEELTNDVIARDDIRRVLSRVRDLERLAARIGTGGANARDLVALAESLGVMPELQQAVYKTKSDVLSGPVSSLPNLDALRELISSSIVDDPPHVVTEGGDNQKRIQRGTG